MNLSLYMLINAMLIKKSVSHSLQCLVHYLNDTLTQFISLLSVSCKP